MLALLGLLASVWTAEARDTALTTDRTATNLSAFGQGPAWSRGLGDGRSQLVLRAFGAPADVSIAPVSGLVDPDLGQDASGGSVSPSRRQQPPPSEVPRRLSSPTAQPVRASTKSTRDSISGPWYCTVQVAPASPVARMRPRPATHPWREDTNWMVASAGMVARAASRPSRSLLRCRSSILSS